MKAWVPLLLVCALALGRALTAPSPELAPESDDALMHKAFSVVASEEHAMRREAAKTFPSDPWSRDDDFHQREWRKVREWGGSHHVRTSDMTWALDEGLRHHWTHANLGPLQMTVPPCRPRAIY